MKNVFCKNCRWSIPQHLRPYCYSCHSSERYKESQYHYQEAQKDLNSNNDCKYYQKK